MVKVTRSVDPQAVPAGPVAALGFSYSITLDDKRNLVLQTHLPLDCQTTALDTALDKMSRAADRQAAKYLVKALKRSLAMQSKQLRRVTEDLRRQDEINEQKFVSSGKKGNYRLSNDQEVHRTNVLIQQSRFQEEIDDIKREITDAEAVANGLDGGTNS